MEFIKLDYETKKIIKRYFITYLIFWLSIFNTVLCGWNNRNQTIGRGGGLKIGQRERNSGVTIGGSERGLKPNTTGGRLGSGVKIGVGGTLKPKEIPTVTEMTRTTVREMAEKSTNSYSNGNSSIETINKPLKRLNLQLLLPHKRFGTRDYNRAISAVLTSLTKKLDLFKTYDIDAQYKTLMLTPSPTSKYKYSYLKRKEAIRKTKVQ